MSIWTIEEIDAQIANIKKLLMSPNASYSIGPADGGASRSVSRWDRDKLNKELSIWARRRKALLGNTRCRTLPVCKADFSGGSSATEGWEIDR